MEVVCVGVCVGVGVCYANWIRGGMEMGVAYCKTHNFLIDSQTCTRFSGKVGHESKNS